jgi:uncharacterized protein YlaI
MWRDNSSDPGVQTCGTICHKNRVPYILPSALMTPPTTSRNASGRFSTKPCSMSSRRWNSQMALMTPPPTSRNTSGRFSKKPCSMSSRRWTSQMALITPPPTSRNTSGRFSRKPCSMSSRRWNSQSKSSFQNIPPQGGTQCNACRACASHCGLCYF